MSSRAGGDLNCVMIAHVAGIPFEEWVMPVLFSAGAVFVGLRAKFNSSRR